MGIKLNQTQEVRMVNIQLDPEWRLESDKHQWILVFNGRNEKFCTSLENAIVTFFELKIRSSEAKSFSALVEYHKQLICKLQQLLTPFQIEIVSKKVCVKPTSSQSKLLGDENATN